MTVLYPLKSQTISHQMKCHIGYDFTVIFKLNLEYIYMTDRHIHFIHTYTYIDEEVIPLQLL